MRTRNKKKASALIVAVGLLAVLSAMAFTYVTIMRMEIEASVVSKTSTQTAMLDQWALQGIVDHLTRAPYEGAMYTPVDWAGERWHTRPIIADLTSVIYGKQCCDDTTCYSPALPLGGCLSVSQMLPGKGTFTIDARIIDCGSQVNLMDGDPLKEGKSWVDRKIRLLTGIPFAIDFARDENDIDQIKPMPRYRNTYRLTAVQADFLARKIQEASLNGEPITTKEHIFQLILKNKGTFEAFDCDRDAPRRKLTGRDGVDTLSDFFNGKKDAAGNTLTVGFKDFITLNSYIDEKVMDANTWKRARRAPINVNTASSFVLRNVFSGLQSTENAGITDKDARLLTDYIVAYRTPAAYLTTELRRKQERLIDLINDCMKVNATINTADPKSSDELPAHVARLAQMLANPEFPSFDELRSKPDLKCGFQGQAIEKFELIRQLYSLHNRYNCNDRRFKYVRADGSLEFSAIPLAPTDVLRLDANRNPDDLLELGAATAPNRGRPKLYCQLPRPFTTWAQFDAFLKVIVYGADTGKLPDMDAFRMPEGRRKARLIMANCNPNTNYSRTPLMNTMAIWTCGKDDVRSNTETTELCFSSYGRFEAELQVSSFSPVIWREGVSMKVTRRREENKTDPDSFQTIDDMRNIYVARASAPFNAFVDKNLPPDPQARCFFLDNDNKLQIDKAFKVTAGQLPLRTLRGSPYTPDRLSFFNNRGELIGSYAIYDYITDRYSKRGMLVLDRPIAPVFPTRDTRDVDGSEDPDWQWKRLDDPGRTCLLLDANIFPKTAIAGWAIERPQSVKKYTSVFNFAEVIKIDTQQDFVRGNADWNKETDKTVTFMPNQRFESGTPVNILPRDGSILAKTRSWTDNLRAFPIPDNSALYFSLPFDVADSVKPNNGSGDGSGDVGRVFVGNVYATGYKIGRPRPTDSGLKFPFYTFFPNEEKGKPIEFTVGMWVSFNDKPGGGQKAPIFYYETTNPAANVKTTIRLEATPGTIELFLMAEKKGMAPVRLQAAGPDAIQIGDWLTGEWHYVGFAFSENYKGTGQAQAQLFSTKLVDKRDHYEQIMEVKDSPRPDPENVPLPLYEDAGGSDRVNFGGDATDAIVDDIIVLKGYFLPEEKPSENKMVRRFLANPTTYLMAPISLNDSLDGTEAQFVEYGTVSWTEYMPANYLARGPLDETKMRTPQPGRLADARIGINYFDPCAFGLERWIEMGRDRWIRPNGVNEDNVNGNDDDGDDRDTDTEKQKPSEDQWKEVRRNPAWLPPIWFGSDYIMAGWGALARIGLNGEGQRIPRRLDREEVNCDRMKNARSVLNHDRREYPNDWVTFYAKEPAVPNDPYVAEEPAYTGYMPLADSAPPIRTFTNEIVNTNKILKVRVNLIGTRGEQRQEEAKEGDLEPAPEYVNDASPWVDDITITFFPPLNVYYWRQASDINE